VSVGISASRLAQASACFTRGVVFLLLCLQASAATVHGTIFDEETQNPIARTRVTLVPLPGTTGPVTSQLADERGAYLFSNVPPGWYLVRATRIGYATGEYGQARPGRPGTPFEVAEAADSNESHQIVMRHQSVITGSVVDDNGIGIPGWPVSLYTARQPIQRLREATTDDRGDFRLGELEPGTYLVRAGGGGLDDVTTLVPSYYKYGTAVTSAELVRVRLGETQSLIVIHTVEGPLHDIAGEITTQDDPGSKSRPVRLTLITDTGRRLIANAAGPFAATGVPPGTAELLVEGIACAAYQRLNVDRNIYSRIDCRQYAPPVVTGLGSNTLIARRLDRDGPGPELTLAPGDVLGPGHWEFTVRPASSEYLVAIQNQGDASSSSPAATPPPPPYDGWFALDIGNAPALKVTLSPKPASITGVVSSPAGAKPGAPVYLELLNPEALEVPIQSWNTRADAQGRYTFSGLPPGSYRLLSGFDLDLDDPVTWHNASAATAREGDSVNRPLDLIPQ